MKKVLSGLAAAVVLTLSTQVMAAEERVYVLAGIGSMSMANAGTLPNTNTFRIGAGTKAINPDNQMFFASELDLVNIGDSTSGTTVLSQKSLRLAIQIGKTVAKDFSLTGKIGGALNRATITSPGFEATATTLGVMYGVGAQYAITKNVVATLDWEAMGKFKAQSSADGSDMTQITAGAQYLF